MAYEIVLSALAPLVAETQFDIIHVILHPLFQLRPTQQILCRYLGIARLSAITWTQLRILQHFLVLYVGQTLSSCLMPIPSYYTVAFIQPNQTWNEEAHRKLSHHFAQSSHRDVCIDCRDIFQRKKNLIITLSSPEIVHLAILPFSINLTQSALRRVVLYFSAHIDKYFLFIRPCATLLTFPPKSSWTLSFARCILSWKSFTLLFELSRLLFATLCSN